MTFLQRLRPVDNLIKLEKNCTENTFAIASCLRMRTTHITEEKEFKEIDNLRWRLSNFFFFKE